MLRIVRVVCCRENRVKTLSHESAASRSGTKRIFTQHDALGRVSADSLTPRHELDSTVSLDSLQSSVLRQRLVTLCQSRSPTQSVGTRRFDATAFGRTTRATGIGTPAPYPVCPPPITRSNAFATPSRLSSRTTPTPRWTVPEFLDSPLFSGQSIQGNDLRAPLQRGVQPGRTGESR